MFEEGLQNLIVITTLIGNSSVKYRLIIKI